MKKEVIETVNEETVSIVKKLLDEVKSDNSSAKECKLITNSTTGKTEYGLQIFDLISESKILVHIEASGVLDTAGTLVVAAGTKGHRVAKKSAKFRCKDVKEYSADTKEDDLNCEDSEVYDAFESLVSKKSKSLLCKFQDAELFSGETAKKLGIIDEVISRKSRKKEEKSKEKKEKASNEANNITSDNTL